MSAQAEERKPLPANSSDDSATPLAHLLARAVSTQPSFDPDLARIIDAWLTLPPPIKAAIVALLDATGKA